MYCFDLITCILSLSFIFGLIVPVTVIITLCRGEIKIIIIVFLVPGDSANEFYCNLRRAKPSWKNCRLWTRHHWLWKCAQISEIIIIYYHRCVVSFCSQVTVANFTFFSSNLMAHGKIVLDMCNCFHDRCGEILDFSTSVMSRNLWYLWQISGMGKIYENVQRI